MLTTLQAFELPWIIAVQGNGEWSAFMIWCSYAGWHLSDYALPVVFFLMSRRAGAQLYLVYYFGLILIETLKLVLRQPRPYWLDPQVVLLAGAENYGMPSGHAFAVTITLGYIASLVNRAWFNVFVIGAICLVSLSRVYLGVHFYSDVIAGCLLAVVVMWLWKLGDRRFAGWLGALSSYRQMGLVLFLSASSLGAAAILSGLGDPEATGSSMYAPASSDVGGLLRQSGALYGVGVALVMARHVGSFDEGGCVWRRAISVVYVITGTWMIRSFSGTIFNEHQSIAMFFSVIVSPMWSLFVGPWVLVKTGWLPRAPVGCYVR